MKHTPTPRFLPLIVDLLWLLSSYQLFATPDLSQARLNEEHELVRSYEKKRDYTNAIIHQQAILNFQPDNDDERFKLANLLTMSNDSEKALPIYHELVAHYPHFYPGIYNYAYTLKNLDRFEEAIPLYNSVLLLKPDYGFAHFGLAQCYLTRGELEKGWPDFEWRDPNIPKDFPHQDLRNVSLEGKKILIRGEWGFGDNFQFIRYAKLLKERGATVIVYVYKQLIPLFSRCSYIDQLIDTYSSSFPHVDMQIPLLSLPYAFNTTLETIPAPKAYLIADNQLMTYWQQKLSANHGLKIGINWHGCGDSTAPDNLNKNIPLTILMNVLADITGIHLYSLQKNCGLEELEALGTRKNMLTIFENLDEQHGPFMDTAAIISSLDLVISVDTSIAHLAGALGKPVWLLLPHKADWRWFLNRNDSPWYPTMRLFRQPAPGDWQGVMNAIRATLLSQLDHSTLAEDI